MDRYTEKWFLLFFLNWQVRIIISLHTYICRVSLQKFILCTTFILFNNWYVKSRETRHGRHIFINKKYPGCPGDEGWLVVADSIGSKPSGSSKRHTLSFYMASRGKWQYGTKSVRIYIVFYIYINSLQQCHSFWNSYSPSNTKYLQFKVHNNALVLTDLPYF